MDDYNEFYKAWQDGFKAGIEAARKQTFKDHYEALCKEIRDTTKQELVRIIKEHFNE